MKRSKIIYVGKIVQDEYWFAQLSAALEKYAPVQAVGTITSARLKKYHDTGNLPLLFIIDSGSNRRFTALVSRLHSSLPTAKILVFSATPTWKETREAMYAGANDYCRKLLNKDEILEKVGQLIGPPDE